MNGDSDLGLGMGVDLVKSSGDRMVGIVAGLHDLNTAEMLRTWIEATIDAMEVFFRRAIPLIKASPSGRIIALMQISKALAAIQRSYLDLVVGQVEDLRFSAAPFRSTVGADGPQPGDVRTVFSVPQVYVDGCWWELGSRCAP